MSDVEDIEFLGSRPAPQTSIQYHDPSTVQRPNITGVALNVQKSSSHDAYRLVFNRSGNSVIQIGRRPGSEPENAERDIESGRAMFRCAVVSRKHAKIAFSDSGHVYLIDLSSHHGTHVRKPGEFYSKTLTPEVPMRLADGDIVTFGKTVGRNEEYVRPVVAWIELLSNTRPIKPLLVPTSTSSPESTKSLSSLKSASGRYGVYSSSSSDELPSSPLEIDSDIEEIPPPPRINNLSSDLTQGPQGSNYAYPFSRAIGVLKRCLPPARVHNSDKDNTTPPEMPVVTGSGSPPPTLAPLATSISDLLPVLPPLQDILGTGPASSKNDSHTFYNRFRSDSPMDLESPTDSRAASPILNLPTLDTAREPSVVEVQPDRSASDEPIPVIPSTAIEVTEVSKSPAPEHSAEVTPGPQPVEPESSQSRESTETPSHSSEDEDRDTSSEASDNCSVTPTPETTLDSPIIADQTRARENVELQMIKEDIEQIQSDVRKLHAHRRKYRSRFNTNVQTLADKLNEYDTRLAEMNTRQANLSDKVDQISRIDIPDITSQLEDMQEHIEDICIDIPELQQQVDTLDDEVEDMATELKLVSEVKQKAIATTEEVKNEIKTLQNLIEEMKFLRETTRTQMTQNLKEVSDMCETTMAKIASEYAQTTMALSLAVPETPVLPSLKRKRDDTDENETSAEDIQTFTSAARHNTSAGPSSAISDPIGQVFEMPFSPAPVADEVGVVAESGPLDSQNTANIDAMQVDAPVSSIVAPLPDSPPPKKRLRKLASVMAHTATAVTIGAVATWSALAFS